MTTRRTRSGRVLSDSDLDALAVEVESTEYDVEALKARRRGRPPLGSGPADVVPVRIDPELRERMLQAAEASGTTTSDIIRKALRHYLDVA
ncbi:ribbon-helix-helix protein, CopG family [Candidatus Poriferisodalis sp.]|uniref:ribbon-helix-helix protein, CopG family n=1 Tax=Candidatus Poriferisodalis sp. TaxID=3101277 RepID=UPI0022892CC0|nr:ribbon-helix-helix protein, CopG family [Acidimicrobiaceae bacterium]MDE0319030.1 ribbon-helix-helix protein, CopG family [Acidimicrobiaceae bacterium]